MVGTTDFLHLLHHLLLHGNYRHFQPDKLTQGAWPTIRFVEVELHLKMTYSEQVCCSRLLLLLLHGNLYLLILLVQYLPDRQVLL